MVAHTWLSTSADSAITSYKGLVVLNIWSLYAEIPEAFPGASWIASKHGREGIPANSLVLQALIRPPNGVKVAVNAAVLVHLFENHVVVRVLSPRRLVLCLLVC